MRSRPKIRKFPIDASDRVLSAAERVSNRLEWSRRRSGGIGRRDGFKIRFPQGSVGSSPTFGIGDLPDVGGRVPRIAALGPKESRQWDTFWECSW